MQTRAERQAGEAMAAKEHSVSSGQRTRRSAPLAVLLLALSCSTQAPFEGLAPALDKGGPKVRFDLAHTPLPETPFPIDVLARADPTSPTGLRVNLPLEASTLLETGARGLFDQLDGFGTFAPITVSFDQPLDFLDLWQRQNDSDPTNDALYLIDLTTGASVPLDLGSGRFPYELLQPQPYFLGDPLAQVTNLLFPVSGADANLLHPLDPGWAAAHGGVPQASDDLMGFYEKSTHTLIARPVQPLLQEHRYAVVLTSALKGAGGQPVSSPFAGINHAAQTQALSALPRLLPAWLPLSSLTFAWSFTTQSTTRELEAIRAGLTAEFEGDVYGSGPLYNLATRFPVINYAASSAFSMLVLEAALPSGDNPYLLPASTMIELLQDPQIAQGLFGLTGSEAAGIIDSLAYVDYFVSGTFESPDFLADLDRPAGSTAFQLDLSRGTSRAYPVRIPFFAAVPKMDLAHFRRPPFPTVLAMHDQGGSRLDQVVAFAGAFARFGFATFAIDAWGQGLSLTPAQETALRAAFKRHGLTSWPACLSAAQPVYTACSFADSVFTATRARDLDADGVNDAGGAFFGADPIHTRDALRQSVVDWLQASRLLRSFDGNYLMLDDAATAKFAAAGDFNLDGIPDFGGPAASPRDLARAGTPTYSYAKGDANPGADQLVFGVGLGGGLAGMVAAIEPTVRAGVLVDAGGGLADLALRGAQPGVRDPIWLGLAGPILATCDWSAADQACGGAGGVPSLVLSVQRVNAEAIVPVAPLTLAEGDVVTACDLSQDGGLLFSDTALASAPPAFCRQATAQAGGALRLPLGADGPQLLTSSTTQGPGTAAKVAVSVVRAGDGLRVLVQHGQAAPVAVDSFRYASHFSGIDYPLGAPLRAPAGGYGRDRNTPEARRALQLWQTAVEAGDPVNYAPYWFQSTLAARQGLPANLLLLQGAGDPLLPASAGLSLARAAGLVETAATDATFGMPIDRLLTLSSAAEGAARLQRFASPAAGPLQALGPRVLCGPPNDCSGAVVLDPSGLACDETGQACADGLAAPRLSPPLRSQLLRYTSTQDGNPVGLSALELPLFSREGRHGLRGPQPQAPFDLDLFLANQAGRYFETRGRELHFEACQAQRNACPWIFAPVP
jgi:hypothetical protein